MEYWTALQIIQQASQELGLKSIGAVSYADDAQSTQLTALLNSGGNELLYYYPWEQFLTQWEFTTIPEKDAYDLPADWAYFLDQTQWDRTNFWPLLGPKTPQEWAWLKGGLLRGQPRQRYRVYKNKFWLHPVPGSEQDLAMEYVQKTWVTSEIDTAKTMVSDNDDIVLYNPWLVVKFIKFKFYELKGFDTTGVQKDFMRIFESLTGKGRGAPKLSLAPTWSPVFIGPWSVPDGSWDVGP